MLTWLLCSPGLLVSVLEDIMRTTFPRRVYCAACFIRGRRHFSSGMAPAPPQSTTILPTVASHSAPQRKMSDLPHSSRRHPSDDYKEREGRAAGTDAFPIQQELDILAQLLNVRQKSS